MPELYVIIARKIFFPNFRGHMPPATVSYAMCLGVKIEAEFTFSTHVKQVAQHAVSISFANCGPFDQLLLQTML